MTEQGRTRFEQEFDANYGRICAGLEARLFSRIAGVFDAMELLGGSAAMVGVLSTHSAVAVVGGLMLAAVPILNRALGPAEKAWRSRATGEAFVALLRDGPSLADEEFERRLRSVQLAAGDYVEALRFVSYNAALDEAGESAGHFALTRWQRMVKAIA